MNICSNITLTSSIFALVLAVFFGVFQFNVQKYKQISIQEITQENIPQLLQDIFDSNDGNESIAIANALENFQRRIIIELTFRAIENETLDYTSSLLYVWTFFSTIGDKRLDATNIGWTLGLGFGSFFLLGIAVSYLAIKFFFFCNNYFEDSLGMGFKENLNAETYVLKFKRNYAIQKRNSLNDPVLERDKFHQPVHHDMDSNRRSIVNKKIAYPKNFKRFAAVHGWLNIESVMSGFFMALILFILPTIVSGFFCWFFEEKNYVDNLIQCELGELKLNKFSLHLYVDCAPDSIVSESDAWYEVIIIVACSSFGLLLLASTIWRVSYDIIAQLSWYGSDERALYNMQHSNSN